MRSSKISLVFLGMFLSASVFACTSASNIERTAPDETFIDNGDGTVTSINNGVTWARCSVGQTYNSVANVCEGVATSFSIWYDALQSAVNANSTSYLGHDKWRLPNAIELNSIVEFTCLSPSINATTFPNTPAQASYYSNTPSKTAAGEGVLIPFFMSGTSQSYRVRLVKQ